MNAARRTKLQNLRLSFFGGVRTRDPAPLTDRDCVARERITAQLRLRRQALKHAIGRYLTEGVYSSENIWVQVRPTEPFHYVKSAIAY